MASSKIKKVRSSRKKSPKHPKKKSVRRRVKAKRVQKKSGGARRTSTITESYLKNQIEGLLIVTTTEKKSKKRQAMPRIKTAPLPEIEKIEIFEVPAQESESIATPFLDLSPQEPATISVVENSQSDNLRQEQTEETDTAVATIPEIALAAISATPVAEIETPSADLLENFLQPIFQEPEQKKKLGTFAVWARIIIKIPSFTLKIFTTFAKRKVL